MFVNQHLEGLNFLKRNIYSASQIMGKMVTKTKLKNDMQYTLWWIVLYVSVRAMWQMLTGHTVTYLHKQTNYDNYLMHQINEVKTTVAYEWSHQFHSNGTDLTVIKK